MAKSLREKLRERLRDREYRHAYADESLNTHLASQIRVLREQRHLSQAQLGILIGTQQSGVSRMEHADYAAWSIKSLKKVAAAFALRLHISFEPFGSLWKEMTMCDKLHLRKPSFDADPEFREPELSSSSATPANLFCRTDMGRQPEAYDERFGPLRKSPIEDDEGQPPARSED